MTRGRKVPLLGNLPTEMKTIILTENTHKIFIIILIIIFSRNTKNINELNNAIDQITRYTLIYIL